RPTPETPIAKLHSCVFSNSSRCGGDITLSTRSRDCCGVSGFWVIGWILPWTFIDGGMPAVMNRSDAFWCAISLRNEVKSMLLMYGSCGAGIRNSGFGIRESAFALPSNLYPSPASRPLRIPNPDSRIPASFRSLEKTLLLRVFPGLLARDHAALDQVLQVLVEGHHAVLLAGLDRRIHLRHLVLADQVADGGDAHHDFPGRGAASADALEQRLRDHRAQRLGQHRAHHRLLAGGEHVDDAVDGLGRRTGVQGAEHQVAGFRGG